MGFECNKCKKEEDFINQNIFRVRGRLDYQSMGEYEKESEYLEIENGDIAYYYFEAANEDIIRGNLNAAGIARSICRECIETSIENTFTEGDPHYCDGVYLTLHNNLNNSDDMVKRCHGIYVGNRRLRVKFRIDNEDEFLKILGTGGVLKTNEKDIYYPAGSRIFLNKNDNKVATYLCIEEYKDGRWSIKKERSKI